MRGGLRSGGEGLLLVAGQHGGLHTAGLGGPGGLLVERGVRVPHLARRHGHVPGGLLGLRRLDVLGGQLGGQRFLVRGLGRGGGRRRRGGLLPLAPLALRGLRALLLTQTLRLGHGGLAVLDQSFAVGLRLTLELAQLVLAHGGLRRFHAGDLVVVEPEALGAVVDRDHAGGVRVPCHVGATQLGVAGHGQVVVHRGVRGEGLPDHLHHALLGEPRELELLAVQQQPRRDVATGACGVVGVETGHGLGREGHPAGEPLLQRQLRRAQLRDLVALPGLLGLHRGGDHLRVEVAQLLPAPHERPAGGGLGAQQVGREGDRRGGLQGERRRGEVHVPIRTLRQLGQHCLVLGGDEDRLVDQLLQSFRHGPRLTTGAGSHRPVRPAGTLGAGRTGTGAPGPHGGGRAPGAAASSCGGATSGPGLGPTGTRCPRAPGTRRTTPPG